MAAKVIQCTSVTSNQCMENVALLHLWRIESICLNSGDGLNNEGCSSFGSNGLSQLRKNWTSRKPGSASVRLAQS